jgi:tol-pal system protein YbgF
MSSVLKKSVYWGLILLSSGVITGCATSRQRGQGEMTEAQKIDALTAQNKQLEASLAALNTKLDSMDAKIGTMNDKVDQTRTRMDNIAGNSAPAKPNTQGITPAPVSKPALGENDENEKDDSGYTADEAIQKYRSAMILFESHNYPEAILGFSSFVDQFPDHPLAGDAQYFLGESYFKQKEYKLAARELNRVLTTYDRSSHVSDALRDLAVSEEKTGETEAAARHRQQLLSLFPSSPAAAEAPQATPEAAPQAPKEAMTPASATEDEQEQPHSVPKPTEPAPPTPTSATSNLDAPPPTAPENTGK